MSALLHRALPCPAPEAVEAPRPFVLTQPMVDGMDDMAGIRLDYWPTSEGIHLVAIDQQRNVRQVGVLWSK